MNSPITAKVAAAQIIALVNSRPATPWPQEVEAIIARVLTCPETSTSTASIPGEVTPALASLYAEWDRVRVRYESAEEDAEVTRWSEPFEKITEKLLAFGARSLADLRLLLPAVVHWNSPMHVESPR